MINPSQPPSLSYLRKPRRMTRLHGPLTFLLTYLLLLLSSLAFLLTFLL